MNILVINWQDRENINAGGAEVHLYEVFQRIASMGHNVALLCSRGQKQPRYTTQEGFTVYRIGNRNNFNFFVPWAISRITAKHRIDVIVDDLNKIPFYSPWHSRRPVVALLHHLFRHTIFRETNVLFASYVYLTESLISLCYRKTPCVVVSESTGDDLKAMRLKPANIHVVYNGIPQVTEKMKSNARDRALVAYVGRVKRYKSIEHFLRAAAIVARERSIRTMVVGDGDALEGLKKLAQQLQLDVAFTGFVSEEEKYKIFTTARMTVQPSIKEGWGLTVIEAQSCGTPVVCADSPGLREAIIDQKTGFLYPYGDIASCAQHMRTLLDNNTLWDSFSRAARTWAQKFSWDRAAQQIETILRRTAGHGKVHHA